ncbi:hypothetical protein BDN67DRAFT_971787 [Paxillus ammoniavirescens]|nr:hypothetical protein BDN67DRAFT_971787 [Paxillus ammoniavirescens]
MPLGPGADIVITVVYVVPAAIVFNSNGGRRWYDFRENPLRSDSDPGVCPEDWLRPQSSGSSEDAKGGYSFFHSWI